MKRIRTALCLILAAALLAGCAFLPSDSEPETPAPTDPLTGQEQLWPGQRPVAVSIENASDSTTQWGLSAASVVLEARTELQGSTRLCLVYPSVNAVPQVGPVAAGEDLYWRLLVGQQVIPVQRGGGQFDQNYLDYYSLRPVDALEAGRNAFSCPAGWSNAPLWYTSGSALSSALETLNISSTLTESRVTTAASAAADSAMPVAGDLSIDTDSHQVCRAGKAVDLTQREYELLTFLASHPNKVYSRVALMEQVWNYGYVGDDVRTVDVTVRRLREKIEADPANPVYILTRRGAGYYFKV